MAHIAIICDQVTVTGIGELMLRGNVHIEGTDESFAWETVVEWNSSAVDTTAAIKAAAIAAAEAGTPFTVGELDTKLLLTPASLL